MQGYFYGLQLLLIIRVSAEISTDVMLLAVQRILRTFLSKAARSANGTETRPFSLLQIWISHP